MAVWSEFAGLGAKYKCESLGQGAPNINPPTFLVNAMVDAMNAGENQYCRSYGHPALVKKIAEKYAARLGRDKLCPMKEVLITCGANGSLSAFVNAYANQGDHVVALAPMFPMYLDHVEFAGAKTISVPLYPGEDGSWTFDWNLLESSLKDPKTKIFMFNSPHNPTGKVFTAEEIQRISDILDDCPHVFVISDEVYEFLTFDGREHVCFAKVGNNWERTVSIFSGGKLLNCTGWKVGWAVGPEKLLRQGTIIANSNYYCVNTPAQVAIAQALDQIEQPGYNKETGKNFVDDLSDEFLATRDYLVENVRDMALPWTPESCDGGYFLIVNISKCRDLIP